MTAKKYEFSPSVVNVKKGEKLRLVITATDCDHGFKLDAFGINQVLKKGDPAIIEFTADKAGAFDFTSGIFCGKGHHKMKGKLVVPNLSPCRVTRLTRFVPFLSAQPYLKIARQSSAPFS